jgi:arylsulfatase A-like enzyme
MKKNLLIKSLSFLVLQAAFSPYSRSQTMEKRPNIVIILADDMGYSDMGMFGSEIKTPNMDALALNGVRFTNFYTHASCSPTRSMLLSGQDTHLNGLGAMDEWTAPNQMGKEGYEGYLSTNLVTLPQLLKDAGYHTWVKHLTRFRPPVALKGILPSLMVWEAIGT